MKKLKTLVILSSIGFSSMSFAYSANPLYVAADAGIFHANFQQTLTDQVATITTNYSGQVEQHGYNGGVAIGYSQLVKQQYLLGVELAGNLASDSASYSPGLGAFSESTQIKRYADLTFVPGFLLNDSTALYAKIGGTYSHVQDNTSSASYVYNTLTTNEYNTSKNILGFVAGVGVKKFFTDHLAGYAEGTYRDYGNVNFNPFANQSDTYAHKVAIDAYNFAVGVAYHF